MAHAPAYLLAVMITTAHTCIRTTEPDDAPIFAAIYGEAIPRAAALDAHREPVCPSPAEMRDMLSRKDAKQGALFTLEDHTGVIRGFISIRGVNPESRFAEVSVLFADPADYASPMATEAAAFVDDRAFTRMHLHKVLSHATGEEDALRAFYLENGYTSCGVQREVFHAAGQWRHIETFTRLAPGA